MKFTGERVVINDMADNIPTLQEHIARYNFALFAATGQTVLDAACGTGYGTNLLSKAAAEVTGVDISNEAITYASKLYPDIPFGCMDLNKIFPADAPFDLCVSFETIEHLENPEVFLKNVAEKCKSFIFSVPVSNPSKYHKQVWNKEEIMTLTGKYFPNITWYHQDGINITEGIDDDATFLIGSA